LGRAQQRVDCLRTVVAAAEVVREEARALGRHLSRLGLEEVPDALVELPTLLQEQALVRHLLRQALPEAILVAREHALAVEAAALLELGELAVEVDALALEERGQLVATELAAEHGRHLHDALGRRAETVEPGGDALLPRA